jgi:hypothetical protein
MNLGTDGVDLEVTKSCEADPVKANLHLSDYQ